MADIYRDALPLLAVSTALACAVQYADKGMIVAASDCVQAADMQLLHAPIACVSEHTRAVEWYRAVGRYAAHYRML